MGAYVGFKISLLRPVTLALPNQFFFRVYDEKLILILIVLHVHIFYLIYCYFTVYAKLQSSLNVLNFLF